LPDHFGQIYFELVEAAITSLERNDEKQFEKILPMVLSLCVLASDVKFANPELELTDEYRLHLVSTAINDLTSVLGYAILYGAYFEKPALSELATQKFATLLEQVADKPAYLKTMLVLSNLMGASIGSSPRANIRFGWKHEFERRAREDGYGSRYQYGEGKRHKDPTIDVFLHSYADASHLFLATQVLPMIEPLDFKIDHQIVELARELAENKLGSEQ